MDVRRRCVEPAYVPQRRADNRRARCVGGARRLCSARRADGSPVAKGIRATGFSAIKDDLINAGATFVDEAVVVDGPFITSRTPADLVPFCHAVIDQMAAVEAS
jgi:putative intracellular protease/amidase